MLAIVGWTVVAILGMAAVAIAFSLWYVVRVLRELASVQYRLAITEIEVRTMTVEIELCHGSLDARDKRIAELEAELEELKRPFEGSFGQWRRV